MAEGFITSGCDIYIEQDKGGGRDLYLEAESENEVEFWKHKLCNNCFLKYYALIWNIFFTMTPSPFRMRVNTIHRMHIWHFSSHQMASLWHSKLALARGLEWIRSSGIVLKTDLLYSSYCRCFMSLKERNLPQVELWYVLRNSCWLFFSKYDIRAYMTNISDHYWVFLS